MLSKPDGLVKDMEKKGGSLEMVFHHDYDLDYEVVKPQGKTSEDHWPLAEGSLPVELGRREEKGILWNI